jgi:hypothetical protein
MKNHIKRALEMMVVPLAAAIVFLEQTLIHYLNLATSAFARWAPVAFVEAWLVRLPAWAAVLVFFAPATLLFPLKLGALWLFTRGHFAMGVGLLALGKILGTAVVARFYRILHPTLMTLRWFAIADTWFFRWRDRIYGFVKSLPAWQKTAAAMQKLRERMNGLVSALFAR